MAGGDQDDLWIRRFHPAGSAGQRLVCLPHAGGSAAFFRPLSAALAPETDVLSVQYPGRQDRRSTPGMTDLHELARGVADALGRWRDRPLVLLGHSMGATLAFEVARLLEDRGTPVAGVIASGRRAPGRHRESAVHQLADDGIVAELRRLSGTDASLLGDDELVRMILPAIRSDYRAIESYRCLPGATIAAPITVLTGDADPQTTADEASSWRDHTRSECVVLTFPGGHFFISEQATAVVTAVRGVLRDLREVVPGR
ncbi:thioesterase II family protein [Actinoplanes sp. N902-109]|uniref:thioesterase II family protein n=1 Tax=Actinoplanes sp. (strain N902-109) TaxID=649831 RepID=UPI000329478E|nr:alpha/beta fold hydrolase [Actinoplanes sp. N902-109]AGL15949.1 thioesterase [Actinoplanes sp. N902-109]